MRALPLLLCLLVYSLQASAQTYSMGWYKIAGGGGTSAGASYQVTGAIGQPVAGGTLTGGSYALTGGYWSPSLVPQTPAPEIVVEQPSGTDLVDGGSKAFGSVAVGANADLTFTVRNTGTENLTGISVSIDGTDAGLFTVTASPSDVLNPSGGTTFTVRFSPVSQGSKTAALHIASNDADENPFDLTLTGTGIPPGLTARESNRSWRGVASSADGVKLVAVGNNTYIYTSSDSGVNWVEHTSTGQKNWYGVASSADGTKLVAVADSSRIYTSTDSGANWTQQNGTSQKQWRSVASSADGTKLIAGVYTERLWTSTDSGVTWTGRENNRNWNGVASSADGVKLVAVVQNGKIYTSVNSGANWTERMSDLNRQWYGVASSADGTKLVACVYGGQIYTSTDSGATWTAQESSRNWRSVASSADGSYLVAAEQNGQIYVSSDSGVNWSPIDSARNWYSVATSADGSVMVAAVYGDQLYTQGTPSDVFQTGPNFVVKTLADHDDGVAGASDCTLREAIHAANANADDSIITFDPTVFANAQVIQLLGELPALNSNIEIQGPAARVTIRRNSGGNYGILAIKGGKTTRLTRLTLSNGNSPYGGGGIESSGTLTITDCVITGNTASGDGGGIESYGTITMANCIISGNQGNSGGGIVNWGDATVTSCAITGNTATYGGGGIENGGNIMTIANSLISGNTSTSGAGGGIHDFANVVLTIINSTISGNTASDSTSFAGGGAMALERGALLESCTVTGNSAPNTASGTRGGIWLSGGTLTLRNTIVAGNVTQDIQNDTATVTSTGHNLIGLSNAGGSFNQTGDQTGVTDPKLSPLGNYGGTTQTHALQPGSPAINLGDPAFNPNAFTPPLNDDQRGFSRVQGGRVDIGAYESGNSAGIIALLWESLPPGSNIGDYSPTGDKDGDGRNNLVEYATLTSPFSSDGPALVTFSRNSGGTAGTMVLPIRFGAPDLIYSIDYTSDVANPWQEIARYNTGTSTFTPLVSNLGASYGVNTLTFTDGNITGQARGFYRLRVQTTVNQP